MWAVGAPVRPPRLAPLSQVVLEAGVGVRAGPPEQQGLGTMREGKPPLRAEVKLRAGPSQQHLEEPGEALLHA
jgi:hypothetical protein